VPKFSEPEEARKMSIRKSSIVAVVVTAAIAGPTAAASACVFPSSYIAAQNARHTTHVRAHTQRQMQLRFPT
jgi:hypothetical protein